MEYSSRSKVYYIQASGVRDIVALDRIITKPLISRCLLDTFHIENECC